MGAIALRRLIQLPLLLLVIYTITFSLAWAIPGNPLEQEGARRPPQEIEEAMKRKYNLDSAPRFYFSYLDNVRTGYLGPSLKYPDWTVNQIVADALPVSIQLGTGAILLALLIGIPIGVIGAVRRDSVWDWAGLCTVLIGISMPSFVTGTALLMVFSMTLTWFPVGGWGRLDQMVLPMFTLCLPFAAYIARLTRMGMIDVLRSDFVRTARAKGLPEHKVVFGHALKVAFLPVLSFLGPAAAGAMTGSFVIEKVFNIPGMGQHFVAAVLNKDLFLIMGVVLIYSTMLILFNMLVDIAYQAVDPRIEMES
jgi:oligopeptide transport system permease protein